MRHSPEHFGGFYLAAPKSGSGGTLDLDSVVAEQLVNHLRDIGTVSVEVPDITTGERVVRPVELLFTSQRGKLLNDRYWAELRAGWREAAGWPRAGTFHSLHHFFATTLMSNGFEPQDAQKALRHANLRITLETYVHWLPKKDRPRSVVGQVLRQAEGSRTQPANGRDRS